MRRTLVAILSVALLVGGATSARADETTGPQAVGEYNAQQVQASFGRVSEYLRGSGSLDGELDNKVLSAVMSMGNQMSSGLSAPNPAVSRGSDQFVNVGGGWDSKGPYLLFNQFEQDLVISGWGFALGTGICLVPAVGQIACIVTGAVITVLTVFLSHNKKCSGDAKVYLNRLGSPGAAVCV